jgi:hypothetical protein
MDAMKHPHKQRARRLDIPAVVAAVAVAACFGVAFAGGGTSPHYDAGSSTGLSTGGGTLTGPITITGASSDDCVIFGDDGALGCTRTSDTAPATTYYTAQSASPAAIGGTNTTGATYLFGPGQGATGVSAFTFANCGTDTITVTIDGTATTKTEGTHWTAATSDAATCTSAATALKTITGVSASTTCSGEVLQLYKSDAAQSIAISCSDATCCTATNGTDGASLSYNRVHVNRFGASAGTCAAADMAFSWGGSLNQTGFCTDSSGYPYYYGNGTQMMSLRSNVGIQLLNTIQFGWGGGAPGSVGIDAGLARQAAGVVRVTDGSTGLGDLWLDDLIAGTTGGTIDLTSGTDGALSFCNAAKSSCRTFTVDSDGILFSSGWAAANGVSSKSGATYKWIANNSNVLQASDIPIAWSSTTSAQGSVDSGFARDAAGVVRVTDGSSGYGQVKAAGAVTAGTMTLARTAELRTRTHHAQWTNAMVVALGAATTGDITVATLPAKEKVRDVLVVVNTSCTITGTLVVSVGRTGAAYDDYIVDSDLEAAANTMYGNDTAERGTNLTGYDVPSWTGTTNVVAHFESSGNNLDTVTTCTGSVYLTTELMP